MAMKNIRYSLAGGLSQQDVREIHEEALRVLWETGIECRHQKTVDAVGSIAGVKISGDRIRFAPDLVEEYVERARRENPGEPLGNEIVVTGPWNCLNIIDMDTSVVRQSTGADVREMFKLVHVANAGPICPVYPNDIDPRLQLLYLEKSGIELTDGDGSHLEFGDPDMLEFCIAMYKAAGRKYHMDVQFPISPLRFDTSGLETVWKYMDRDDVTITATAAPIPQAGLTAPLPVAAGLVIAAAEALASYILARLIAGNKVDSHPQFRLDLVDMRYLTTVYSSPDHTLRTLLLKDVYEFYYGRRKPGHFIQSNAKRPDIQAVLERTSAMLTLAFAGFRGFCFGAGQLSMDEVFSPAMFVVDREIARFVSHIIKGVDFEGASGAADLIAEIGPGGNFIAHETTIERMRDLFDSDIFPRTNLGQWRAAGEPDPEKVALAKARGIIASHDHHLPDSVQKEIDGIYAEAEKLARQQ
ncbi:MAG: trimethylamine methyltransferase family protein [Armatimonadota bacterium]|nr:trimethylamine methyltransferase family protein [Armatimonadota bacterium]